MSKTITVSIGVYKHKFADNYLIIEGVRTYNPDPKRYEARPVLNIIEKGDIPGLEENKTVFISSEYYEKLCERYLTHWKEGGKEMTKPKEET